MILFVWVPRTAGSSLWSAVASGGVPRVWHKPGRAHFHGCPDGDLPEFVTYQHRPLANLQREGLVKISSKIVAFVRNPWDRLVSVYHHLRSSEMVLSRAAASGTFAVFAERVIASDAPCLLEEEPSNYKLTYSSPQYDYLAVGGKVDISFVGRFESIDKDVCSVFDMLGMHGSIGQSNASRHRPFRDYYDDSLRRRVGKFYEKDCDTFGYVF